MTHSTNEQANGSRVLKTDAKGRVRSTAAQREVVLREFERSGLSGPKFAAVAGIKYQTLAVWRSKQRRQSASSVGLPACGSPGEVGKSRTEVRWVEAMAVGKGVPISGAGVLRVRLRAGMELDITGPQQVPLAAALLRALEGGAL